MKTHIWNCTDAFPSKVNFVDSNNVVLGYDLSQHCCESSEWTISEAKDGSSPIYEGNGDKPEEFSLDGYVFNPEFFEQTEDDGNETYVVIFELEFMGWQRDAKPSLFVRLVNRHNGYYCHGFTFRGAKTIEGSV